MPRRAQSILIWLSTLLFALIAVADGIGRNDRVIGDGVDVFGTFWFYWWVEHCFSRGISPGFTDLMFHPSGKDIFAHTGGNFVDALVALPFQSIFGVPGFQAWFILVVLIGNAATFRVFAGGVMSSAWAVWAASILWMLNPYVLQEISGGRLTQAFLWFLPLAFHCFLKAETGRWTAILSGIFIGLQAWTYWFMAWFMVPALVCLAWAKWRERTVPGGVLLRAYGWAALSAIVVVGPGVWVMLERVNGHDVAGLGLAGGFTGFFDSLASGGDAGLQGWLSNERHGVHSFGQWIWGALAISALFLTHGWRRWAWVLGVSLAFSIGPTLQVGDEWSIPMLHYRLAFHTVPFLERLWFPYRWTVMAFMAAALVGGFWVQHLFDRCKKRWTPALAVSLVLLTMLEQAGSGTIPLVTRGYTVPSLYESLRERPGGIIELPMEVVRESLMWQPIHQQPLFGGMGENVSIFWTPEFRHAIGNRFIQSLRKGIHGRSPRHPHEPSDLAQIRDRGMRWVVLDRHMLMVTLARSDAWGVDVEARKSVPIAAVERLTDLIGSPVAVDGPLVVWDLERGETFPPPLKPTSESFEGSAWTGSEWTAYEARVLQLSDHKGDDHERAP